MWRIMREHGRAPTVFTGAQWADTIVLRALDEALAFTRDGTSRWNVSRTQRHSVAGPLVALAATNAVITADNIGGGDVVNVVALDWRDGATLWTRDLPVQVSTFGLALLGDTVLVHGRAPDGRFRIYTMDAASGAVQNESDASPGSAVLTTRTGAFVVGFGGLFSMSEERQPRKISDEKLLHAVTSDRRLFGVSKQRPGTPELVVVDGGEIHHRVPLPTDLGSITRVVPSALGDLAVVIAETTSVVVAVNDERVIPIQLPERAMAISGAWGPSGLILIEEVVASAQLRVAAYDGNGLRLAELPVRDRVPTNVLVFDELLVVSGSALTFMADTSE